MSEGANTIDSDIAAMLLGISKTNLRQMVFRKLLVPTGRQKRKSLFILADVQALQTRRSAGVRANTSAH